MKKLKVIETQHSPKKEYRPVGILEKEFKYVPAAATDITQTWRKFGWQPIERKEKFYESNS